MTVASELTVELEGREVGLAALLTKVDAQTQKAADSAVRLQQQYARLAQSQGNTAGATSILSSALTNNGGASERALVGVATQLERTRTASGGLGQTVAGLGGQLSQLGGTVGGLAGQIGNLAGSFGSLGALGAVIGIGKIGVDLAQTGANADLVAQRFDGLAKAAGTTGDALLGALRTASGGEIDNLNLQLAANRAQLLGVADSAGEFSTLMAIARDRAQQMGISTTQAFNDLVTGLGRGSPLILDNLGITVSVTEANQAYAASLGKSADALTEAEQKQALINAVLQQGQASLQATGGAIDSNAAAFARAGAAFSNLSAAAGNLIATGIAPLANAFADVVGVLDGTGPSFAAATVGAIDLLRAISGMPPQTEAAKNAVQQYADQLLIGANYMLQLIGVTDAATAATDQHTAAQFVAADAADRVATSTQVVSDALADELQKKVDSQIAAQQLADTQAQLEADSRLAAQGLLGAGDQAVNLANKYGIAAEAAQFLIRQQQALANAAALQEQRAGERNPGSSGVAEAAAQEERRLQQLYRSLADPPKAPRAGRGGGAGGGGRVSVAERERRQLETDEQKFQDKQEALDQDHAERRIAILEKYYDEARKAAAAFSQSQLDSAASFYDSLGDLESGKAQQAASAEYEAAVQEAAAMGGEAGRRYLEEKEKVILARAKRQAEIEQAEQSGDKDKAEYARGVDAKYRAAEDARLQAIKEGGDQAAAERDKALAEEDARYTEASEKAATSAERAAERRAAASAQAGQAVDQEAQKVDALSRAYDKVAARTGAAQPGAATTGTTPPAATGETPPGTTPGTVPADLAALLAKLEEVKQAITGAAATGTADTDGLRAAVVAATAAGAGDIVRAVRSLSTNSVIAG